ncbi:MAG: type II toxin-antitoxin system Phd/YefM family antitoxin [Vicinamibacterales bacterium]
MAKTSASSLRGGLADLLNRVSYNHERVAIERHGKTVAVLVPAEDAALLDELEDRLDLEAARAALKERGNIAWSDLKAKLKLG